MRFKRSAHGWIFQAPTRWILGPRPHYLVDDAEKAKIEVALGASTLVVWLLTAVIAAIVFLWAPLGSVTTLFLFLALYCLLLVVQNFCNCLALRAILKNSPRVSEKIAFDERLKGAAGMYSVEQLKFLLVLFVGLFVGTSLRRSTRSKPVMDTAGSILPDTARAVTPPPRCWRGARM